MFWLRNEKKTFLIARSYLKACEAGQTKVQRGRGISNIYTMGCLPVRGNNPRALASGLSYVQVDKHDITILDHLHMCRPCTSRDSSCQSW